MPRARHSNTASTLRVTQMSTQPPPRHASTSCKTRTFPWTIRSPLRTCSGHSQASIVNADYCQDSRASEVKPQKANGSRHTRCMATPIKVTMVPFRGQVRVATRASKVNSKKESMNALCCVNPHTGHLALLHGDDLTEILRVPLEYLMVTVVQAKQCASSPNSACILHMQVETDQPSSSFFVAISSLAAADEWALLLSRCNVPVFGTLPPTRPAAAEANQRIQENQPRNAMNGAQQLVYWITEWFFHLVSNKNSCHMCLKCKNKSCRALAYQHLTGPGRSEAPDAEVRQHPPSKWRWRWDVAWMMLWVSTINNRCTALWKIKFFQIPLDRSVQRNQNYGSEFLRETCHTWLLIAACSRSVVEWLVHIILEVR